MSKQIVMPISFTSYKVTAKQVRAIYPDGKSAKMAYRRKKDTDDTWKQHVKNVCMVLDKMIADGGSLVTLID